MLLLPQFLQILFAILIMYEYYIINLSISLFDTLPGYLCPANSVNPELEPGREDFTQLPEGTYSNIEIALTEENVNRRIAKISKDNRLRFVLEYLNFNGVLYTLTSNSIVKTKSRCFDRPAS